MTDTLGESDLTSHIIEEWMREIQKVSRRAELEWPGVVEAEDLAQEVVLHILERPGTKRDLAEMDDNARYRTLHKIAQRLASQARTDYEQFSGNFRYSVNEVRKLLESAGDPDQSEVRSSWSTGDFTRSGGDHSDPTADVAIGNVQLSEAQSRLAQALESLSYSNGRQYEALVRRFVDGEIPDREDTATFELINRALVSLTTKMNHGHKRDFTNQGDFFTVPSRSGKPIRYLADPDPGDSWGDGPGSRRAISNSTARYLSKEGWDADYMPAPAHMRDNHIEPEVWDE